MSTVTASRPAAREMTVKAAAQSEAAIGALTAEDVKAEIESRCRAALDEAKTRPAKEAADPYLWWNLWALGPIQAVAPNGPVLPHQVIKLGESAFVATIVVLNDAPILPPAPGISPASVLSGFALTCELQYATGNVTTWTPVPTLGTTAAINFVPGASFYVNVFAFTPTSPGLHEMNVSARILGAAPFPAGPQFGGFARAVIDIDPDLFIAGAPGLQFDQSIRFQVYP
ncbi:MAG: hypothetical protein HGA45_36485 [Chloroflexales bacterium]|nr:hypothetical protein [Chloroflexales bacterium]